MEKLIRIFKYKKVKTNRVIDMVRIVDFANAKINENTKEAIILDGEYQGKVVPLLDSNYEENDFSYLPIEDSVMNLYKLRGSESVDAIKALYSIFYYEIEIHDDKILMKECTDDKIIKAYNEFVSPSVGIALEGLIDNMQKNGDRGFRIPAHLSSQLVGLSDSLKEQDTNRFKKIQDYDIGKKFEELRKIIIGQDSELKILLANILKNISLSYSNLDIQKIRNLKSRIIILGGTGTGKTLMVENIASMLEVPYTIEDARRFTCAGFEGANVEDMLVNLYNAAGEDMEKFEHGIIFIDEIDKICSTKDDRSHVATTDVQEGLLKMIEGTRIGKKMQRGLHSEQVTFDTSKITFVLAGAFEQVCGSRLFNSDDFLLSQGMIPELVARLNTRVITKKPTKEDLKTALVSSKYGYLKLLEEYLGLNGIKVEITDEFIDGVVDRAYEMNQGYRALSKVLNQIVDTYLYDMFNGKVNTLKLSKVNKDV